MPSQVDPELRKDRPVFTAVISNVGAQSEDTPLLSYGRDSRDGGGGAPVDFDLAEDAARRHFREEIQGPIAAAYFRSESEIETVEFVLGHERIRGVDLRSGGKR